MASLAPPEARGASAGDDRSRRERGRWVEVRRAVREAEKLGLYAVEVAGVKCILRMERKSPPAKAAGADDPPARAETRRQQRSRERKDVFHAKKREAAVAALHAAAPAPTTTMVLVGSGPADKRDRAHVEPKTPMRTDDDDLVEEGASGGSWQLSPAQRGGSGKLRRDARPSPLASTVSGAPSSVA